MTGTQKIENFGKAISPSTDFRTRLIKLNELP